MRQKRVLILESNVTLLNEVKDEIEKNDGLTVVYASDDGVEGLKQAVLLKPDAAIVGMFLKGTDGYGVIEKMKEECKDICVIATGVASDSLMERAMSAGAEYYLIKPYSPRQVIEQINASLKESESGEAGYFPDLKEYAQRKKRPVTVDEKISDIFISIGIPPHIKGYAYLREGIKLTVTRPHIINNVTKELYPAIALTFETTPSKVERAIRHAIEVAWNRGRIDAINAIFGTRVYLGTEKPTNSEFIALVADKLILENLM